MVLDTIQNWSDKIPSLMEGVRGIIMRILGFVNLPEQPAFMLVAGGLSFFLAFWWFKKWVAVSVFSRLSILINYILLGVIFYLVIVYV